MLQPGQWTLRVSFSRASSTLNVKNRGFPHFGHEYCSAPVVTGAGNAGGYMDFIQRGRAEHVRPAAPVREQVCGAALRGPGCGRDPQGLRMMQPSEVLKEEHVVIEHLLAVLDGMAERLDEGHAVPAKDLESALRVVVEFADQCHNAKEEKALFPVLERYSPDEGKLLARRLHGDHEAFRHLVRAMREAILEVVARDPEATKMFTKNARTYATLIREHIAKETELLLPLMDRAIPAGDMAKLAAEFDRIEREETGAGVHARYEHTVHALAERYGH